MDRVSHKLDHVWLYIWALIYLCTCTRVKIEHQEIVLVHRNTQECKKVKLAKVPYKKYTTCKHCRKEHKMRVVRE